MGQTSSIEETLATSDWEFQPEDFLLDHDLLPPLPPQVDSQLTIPDLTSFRFRIANMSTHNRRRPFFGPSQPLDSPYPKIMPNGEQHYSKSFIPRRWMGELPPVNFGSVYDGEILRSAFPGPENLSFLRTLRIKTIITLVDTEIPPAYASFINLRGIRHYRMMTPANKESVEMTPQHIINVLRVICDEHARPVLIHCNKGKHRTGCIVGALRKSMGWSLEEILEEYRTYADPKAREHDELFMRSFQPRSMAGVSTADNGHAQHANQHSTTMTLTTATAQEDQVAEITIASSPPDEDAMELDSDSTSSDAVPSPTDGDEEIGFGDEEDESEEI